MIAKKIKDKKPAGILLGSYFGLERDILVCFSLAGYELCHAPTLAEARMYFEASNYDFTLCFESFVDGPALDFAYTLGQEKLVNTIALVDNGRIGTYYRNEGPKIFHFFYVKTSPDILRFFVDQLLGINRLQVEVCQN